MKRFEHKGKHVRLSRTGGVAGRLSASKNGRGLTVNSNHGLRLHQRIGRGFRLGWQNGRFQFIGRVKKGPFDWNISKSGVSGSAKNRLGTFNFIKPRYSSFTIAGINIRGKNAATLHAVYMGVMLIVFFAKILASTILVSFWLLMILLAWLASFVKGFVKSLKEDKTQSFRDQ